MLGFSPYGSILTAHFFIQISVVHSDVEIGLKSSASLKSLVVLDYEYSQAVVTGVCSQQKGKRSHQVGRYKYGYKKDYFQDVQKCKNIKEK